MDKIGRNEPCGCGSGKKYKKCCLKLKEVKVDDKQKDELKKGLNLGMPDPIIQGTGEVRRADGSVKIQGDDKE